MHHQQAIWSIITVRSPSLRGPQFVRNAPTFYKCTCCICYIYSFYTSPLAQDILPMHVATPMLMDGLPHQHGQKTCSWKVSKAGPRSPRKTFEESQAVGTWTCWSLSRPVTQILQTAVGCLHSNPHSVRQAAYGVRSWTDALVSVQSLRLAVANLQQTLWFCHLPPVTHGIPPAWWPCMRRFGVILRRHHAWQRNRQMDTEGGDLLVLDHCWAATMVPE